MKKLGKYVGSILNTYGIITPLIVVALIYVIMISLERNNAFTAIKRYSNGLFITLVVIGLILLVGAVVLVLLNAKKPNVGFIDLALFIVFVLSLLMIILFCFNPVDTSFLCVFKWTVMVFTFLASFAFGLLRSANVKQ